MSASADPTAAPRRLRLGHGAGRMLGLVLFTVGVTSLGLYQVYAQHQVVTLGYAIDRAKDTHDRYVETHKRLELTLATYKDPTQVRAFAEQMLEMQVPGPQDAYQVPGEEEAPMRVPAARSVLAAPEGAASGVEPSAEGDGAEGDAPDAEGGVTVAPDAEVPAAPSAAPAAGNAPDAEAGGGATAPIAPTAPAAPSSALPAWGGAP